MNFFNKNPHDAEHSWLMSMVSGAGLLVMAAVFISSGVHAQGGASSLALGGINPSSQTAGGWWCDTFGSDPFASSGCGGGLASPPIQVFTASPTTYGGNTTLTWGTGFYNRAVWGDRASCVVSEYPGGLPSWWGEQPSRTFPIAATYWAGDVNYYNGNTSVGPLTQTTGYVLNCTEYYQTGVRSGSAATTATVSPPSCSNGLDYPSYPSCSCPGGQHQAGASCVVDACSNGLDRGSYPSCSCPGGQVQSGGSCVPAQCPAGGPCRPEQTSCQNGLSIGAYPSCSCPAGQGQAGASCISAPGVPGGLSASCSHAGTSVNASWGPVSGADGYWVGLDDTSNNTASCTSGWMCTTPPDYTLNQSGTSKTFATTPNHANRLLVSSCNSGVCSGAAELAFSCTIPQPALSITANGQTGLATIPVNTPVTIAWSSQDVEVGSCRVSNNADASVWSGDNNAAGQTVPPMTTSRIYSLQCNKLDGTAATPATVSLGIVPGSIDGPLTATPARVRTGDPTRVSWHTVGMVSCELSGVPGGIISNSLASSGISIPVNSSTTFNLACNDGTSNFTQSIIVGVIPKVTEQ